MSITNPYKYDIFTIFANNDFIIKNKDTNVTIYEYNYDTNKIKMNTTQFQDPLVFDKVETNVVKSENVDKAIQENVRRVEIEKDLIINKKDKEIQECKSLLTNGGNIPGKFTFKVSKNTNIENKNKFKFTISY